MRIFIIIDFRKRRRERDINVREKHRSIASHSCPDQGSNHNLLVYGMMPQPTKSPGQGTGLPIFKNYTYAMSFRGRVK